MATETTLKVQVSARAASEILKLVEQRSLPAETAGLRVGLKGGGCSGFEYICDMVSKADKFDLIFEESGARLIVDRKSLLFLDGLNVDYRRALMGSGFTFENPNVTGTCGCGTSFAV
jgi:iron-sulfur cluster assembly protein